MRPYELIRALARRGVRVTVGTLWSTSREREEVEALTALGVEVIARRHRPVRAVWNCACAVPTPTPLQAAYSWHPALGRDLGAALARDRFTVVHVEHLRGARYGTWLSAQAGAAGRAAAFVWDSVDCISLLFAQTAERSGLPAARLMARLELGRTRRREAWLATRFDRTLVTSARDKAAFDALLAGGAPEPGRPRPHVAVIPNGVDLEYFRPISAERDPATVVLTGKMSYHANATAALHLVRDIMPHVWRQRGDTRVWIVGQGAPRVLRDLGRRDASRVVVTGAVPDLRPYLRQATLAAAPLVYGVGVQNKVLEALACGTPVVASPLAAATLAEPGGRGLAVAESAEAFGQAVLTLLANPARRDQLGREGQAYVERHHSWDAVAARLEAVYRDVVATAPRRRHEPR